MGRLDGRSVARARLVRSLGYWLYWPHLFNCALDFRLVGTDMLLLMVL